MISFLSPWALIALPFAAGLLLYAYRKRDRGNRVVVATLLFLKEFAQPHRTPQKIFPPLRFFLEVIAASILVAGIAGIYSKQSGRPVAIVLDNSLSMRALAPEQSITETLFSLAKNRAKNFAGNLSSATPVRVYFTSPSLTPINSDPISPAKAQALISDTQPSWGEDNLSQAISKVSQKEPDSRIAVFTDGPVGPSLDPNTEIFALYSGQPQGCNGAIAAINPQMEAGLLSVEISAYCSRKVGYSVNLERLAESSGWEQVSTASFSAEGTSTKEMVFSRINFGRPVRVKLAADSISDNVILEDDAAYLAVEGGSKSELTIVSQQTASQLGIERIPGLHASVITPKQYDEMVAQATRLQNPIIFHGVVPAEFPEQPTVFVSVPTDNRLIGSGALVKDVSFVRWEQTHPLLSYLSLEGTKLPLAVSLTPPTWARAIVNSERGPVFYEGTNGRANVAVLGFEIFPFEGLQRPMLSVLLFNIIKWLKGGGIEEGYERAPYKVSAELGALTPQIVSGSDDSIKELPEFGWSLEGPGIFKISGGKLLALNVFSPSESNILTVRNIVTPRDSATQTNSSTSQVLSYASDCALIVWISLLIEAGLQLIAVYRSKAKV